ncbi:hypothetical protein [Streptomyces sp. NPDC087297]
MTLFSDANYQGEQAALGAGRYVLNEDMNNVISSQSSAKVAVNFTELW